MEGNKPEIKFKAGALSATIWQNNSQNQKGEIVTYKTISIDRNYLGKDGAWKSTNSLRVNDLPKAALVLKKAYEHIVLKGDNNAIEEMVM